MSNLPFIATQATGLWATPRPIFQYLYKARLAITTMPRTQGHKVTRSARGLELSLQVHERGGAAEEVEQPLIGGLPLSSDC